MKKTLLFILFTLILSAPLYAQSKSNQHLKFMGIPIDGSITNFQNKLIAKGFKYDKVGSQNLEGPTRIFKGLFAGETSWIYVYYDKEQKFVYRVKVVIQRDSESQISSLMNTFKFQLEEKYSTYAIANSNEDNSCYYLIVPNGEINIFYRQNIYSIGYALHIDYWDNLNYEKNEANNMDDL